VRTQTAGLAATACHYDAKGLLIRIQQGEGNEAHTTRYGYDYGGSMISRRSEEGTQHSPLPRPADPDLST